MKYKSGMIFYKRGDKRKYHIVSIIDEPQDKMIVYKFYGIHKQWWHYEIESKYVMDLSFDSGLYSLHRNGRTQRRKT
jgi:hypothetical protein